MYKIVVLLFLLLAGTCYGQDAPLPSLVFFTGASYDPNGGLAGASVEVGGAKLTGSSTYLGAVAHLGAKALSPFQISTKIQFHVAQVITKFRGAPIMWTAEAGPDIAAAPTAPATGTVPTNLIGTNVGYAVGSGPLISIPVGKFVYVMVHAEMTKGSLSDLGWRGGVMLAFGSN